MRQTTSLNAVPYTSPSESSLPPGTIITIAGTDYDPTVENGRPATEIHLLTPPTVCGDSQGCIYIADSSHHCVWKIDPDGNGFIVAGSGKRGYTGDDGPAVEACLNSPYGLATDDRGDLYITDVGNRRIRRIDAYGIITTIAGTGEPGYSGDGGPATQAAMCPKRLCLDQAGNVYILDTENHCIRKVDASGYIITVAGTGEEGFSGDGGPATQARLGGPEGLCLDDHGNLYIADRRNHRVRMVDVQGVITTVAGTGGSSDWGDGGPATEAALSRPVDVWADPEGNVYIVAETAHNIRKVDRRGIITTLTGNGFGDLTGRKRLEGDGGPAIEAALFFPLGLWSDRTGNLFIAERESHCIRKVDVHGMITTVAGTGAYGYSGDGGPAVRAQLSLPSSIWGDDHGTLYIADSGNHCLRKIDPEGVITTLAGTGEAGDRGDGGPAIRAQLDYPYDLWGDTVGNLYIASKNHPHIRKVDANGVITTVAGTGRPGYEGDGGPAAEARLSVSFGVCGDTSGNLYIADTGNHCIRKVDAQGVITTLAGTGEPGYSGDNGAASGAQMDGPAGVCLDRSGNLYIADRRNHRIRKVDTQGIITTVVGTGARGSTGDNGPATEATLFFPAAVCMDQSDNLFITEWGSYYVRRVDVNGVITTVAGERAGAWAGFRLAPTVLNRPHGIWGDAAGNLYVADTGNNRISKLRDDGVFSTFAGTGQTGDTGDGGPATEARLYGPEGIWGDEDGCLYITERDRYAIRKITPDGIISTMAGNGLPGYSGDGGPALSASLRNPRRVWGDKDGHLYISDMGNHRVRRINHAGDIITIAGTGIIFFSGDGGPATQAHISFPGGICGDETGNLYIVDSANARVRKIDRNGIITTIAGDGFQDPDGRRRFSGDGGPAVEASLNQPSDLCRDDSGNLYIVDSENRRIRKVDAGGVITTIAGNGEEDFPQNGVPATRTGLNYISGLCVDQAGNLYFADGTNHRIRKIDTNGILSTVVGTGVIGYAGDGGPALQAALNDPRGIFIDPIGNLIIADTANNRIRKVIRVASPIIDVHPEALDCGAVAVGSVGDPFDIAITNQGFVPLRVSMRSEHPEFIIHPALLEVAPKDTRTIRVWFAPVEETAVEQVLIVESNDPAASVVRIPLRGQGVRRHDTLRIAAISVEPGGMVRAPVQTHATHPVAGLQFRVLQEAPDLLHFSHFHLTLESGKLRTAASTHEGLTTVVVYAPDGMLLPPGRHALGHLVYRLHPDTPQGMIIPLHLRNILLSDASGAVLPAAGIDGAVLAELSGALSTEGADRLLDLLRLVRILLEERPVPPSDSLDFATVDANGDGLLNLQDVAVLSHRIRGIAAAPSLEAPASPVTLIPGVVQGVEGRALLSLRLRTRTPLDALMIALTWNPEALTVHASHAMGRVTGMTAGHAVRDGMLRLILYSAAGRTISIGDGPVLRIPVTVRHDAPDAPSMRLSCAEAATVQGDLIPVTCAPDTVSIETLPPLFRLRANRPDPFIIETRIPYEVPQAAQVILAVYNALEEEVIRLVDEAKQPGRHIATWNGMDRNGNKLETGTYYCRMNTSTGFTQTRRMRLIR